MKDKKGELTTQQLVIIIVLIVSFGILLFFLFKLNLGETTKKQICHNSVFLKSKSKLGGNLDCKITYICISGEKDCEGTYDFKKEIDLGDKEKARNQIMKIIADEMADCWWMFGEGKVDYIGLNVKDATIGEINCALCSKIKFDQSIKNSGLNTIVYENFYNNLSKMKKDSTTYLEYLYQVDKVKGLFDKEYLEKEINFDNEYFVITGIAKLGALKKTWNLFAGYVDLINKIFPDFFGIAKAPAFKDYGPIPVRIQQEKNLDKLNCANFITKA